RASADPVVNRLSSAIPLAVILRQFEVPVNVLDCAIKYTDSDELQRIREELVLVNGLLVEHQDRHAKMEQQCDKLRARLAASSNSCEVLREPLLRIADDSNRVCAFRRSRPVIPA